MSIQIFILSQLMEDNNYPYKLKKQLSLSLPLDRLGGITESKLYYHFESLVKQGLVEPIEVIKEKHRPDKQVYAITAIGREELPNKIYKLFESAEDIKEMVIGLANLKYVDRDKVVTILERKVSKIKLFWEEISEMDAEHINEAKEFKEFMRSYLSNTINNQIYWLEELIRKIKKEEI